jgi:hypothetical protein
MTRGKAGDEAGSTVGAAKAPVARKPVFAKICPGLGLGYRRIATAGTWVVWAADGWGGNRTKALRTADDFDEADGKPVLDSGRHRIALASFPASAANGDGEEGRPATIPEALDRYEAALETRGVIRAT